MSKAFQNMIPGIGAGPRANSRCSLGLAILSQNRSLRIPWSMPHRAAAHKSQCRKGVVNKLTRLHKDVINFQWKLKKRVSSPVDALAVVNTFRSQVSDTLTFYQQFCGTELEIYLDVEKVQQSKLVWYC